MEDLVLLPDPDAPDLEHPDVGVLVDGLVRRRFLSEQGDPGRAREAARAHLATVLPRLSRLTVAEAAGDTGRPDARRPRGSVWLLVGETGEDVGVVHLDLDDPGLSSRVRDLLAARAREAGHRRLVVELAPGDRVFAELVRGGGFVQVATTMALDLTGPPPEGADPDGAGPPVPPVPPGPPGPLGPLVLRPMGAAAYDVWLQESLETYAEELRESGHSATAAQETSRRQHAELLPDGLATPDQHFLEGLLGSGPEAEVVGHLWIGTATPRAFGYDFVVVEHLRRRGLGEAFVRAGVAWARDRGVHAIGLNVFGHNDPARRLYDRMGFRVVVDVVALDLVGP